MGGEAARKTPAPRFVGMINSDTHTEATVMQKVQWKGSDEKVSAMCQGTMYFGSRVDKETSYRILDAYFDAGGSFLDTANNYAFWIDGFVGDESESLLGQYFADRGNRKEGPCPVATGHLLAPLA